MFQNGGTHGQPVIWRITWCAPSIRAESFSTRFFYDPISSSIHPSSSSSPCFFQCTCNPHASHYYYLHLSGILLTVYRLLICTLQLMRRPAVLCVPAAGFLNNLALHKQWVLNIHRVHITFWMIFFLKYSLIVYVECWDVKLLFS